MGTLLGTDIQRFVTSDGQPMVRRTRKILCPNGSVRRPVDYYDATPGAVKVSEQELGNLAVGIYKKLI